MKGKQKSLCLFPPLEMKEIKVNNAALFKFLVDVNILFSIPDKTRFYDVLFRFICSYSLMVPHELTSAYLPILNLRISDPDSRLNSSLGWKTNNIDWYHQVPKHCSDILSCRPFVFFAQKLLKKSEYNMNMKKYKTLGSSNGVQYFVMFPCLISLKG